MNESRGDPFQDQLSIPVHRPRPVVVPMSASGVRALTAANAFILRRQIPYPFPDSRADPYPDGVGSNFARRV